MQKIILYSLLAASLCLSTGCKLFRKGQKEDPQVRMLREAIGLTQQSNVDFENAYINGKARLEMPEGEFQNLTVDYRIYIDKDEAILVRIKKFIEVAKVYIDQDSIYIQNKINKELYVIPTSESEKFLGFKADFSTLEDVLLGNLNFFGSQPSELKAADLESNPLVLTGQFQTASLTYLLDKEIHKLKGLSIVDSTQNAVAKLSYDSFSEVDGKKIPHGLEIKVDAPQKAGAEFDHKKIELNKKDFKMSFEVPKNYERVDY